MFHSAAIRLTTWYLALVMVLSISTSVALYHVSSNYLEQNTKRQVAFFSGLLGPESASDFASLRQRQVQEDRRQLKASLILFNLAVLAVGGGASYALARRTLRPIEDALEAQVRFTADASHELRTPLAAIQTENEVALRSSRLSKSEAVGLLRSNLEEAGRLKALSEGLLALSHASGDDDLSDDVSLQKVAARAKTRITKVAELKKININTAITAKGVTAKGNEHKLVDLLVILLDNAIKYSPVGSEVKVEVKKQGKYAEISVSDKGQGIKKTDMPNVFERFYRADHSRNKVSADGYGLGLAIAKKIVDQHNGIIEVRSAAGKGSVFSVRLPSA